MEYLQYWKGCWKEETIIYKVLNLIINGIPSILFYWITVKNLKSRVLNLIINGIPSILQGLKSAREAGVSFKPYYKWNTFNTVLLG